MGQNKHNLIGLMETGLARGWLAPGEVLRGLDLAETSIADLAVVIGAIEATGIEIAERHDADLVLDGCLKD